MAEKKEKKDKGGGAPGFMRVILEGGAEALTRLGAEKALGALFGGTPATPPPAGTPGAPAASGFDIGAAARNLLGPARSAELNAHAAQREAELNNAAAALRSLEEDE